MRGGLAQVVDLDLFRTGHTVALSGEANAGIPRPVGILVATVLEHPGFDELGEHHFAIALIVAIEVVAHEVFFGALYLGLITLFARRALNRQLLPLFVAIYVYLLAAGLGFVPTWGAH